MDVEQRLRKVEELTGSKITLVELAESSHDEEEQDHGSPPCWSNWQQQPADTNTSTEMSSRQELELDAPRKFLQHEAGPGARTEDAFDCSGFTIGQYTAEEDFEFCPWNIVQSYPDSYVGRRNRPHVAAFFGRIFEGRVWDFFNLHDPTKLGVSYLFVPTSQLQVLLDFINAELGIALAIPGGDNSERFFMRFARSTLRPRYVGRVHNEEEFDFDRMATADTTDRVTFESSSPVQQRTFLDQLKLISSLPVKDKKRQSKQKAQQKRADREHMLRETQKVLRLRRESELGGRNDPVLVCIDVEALERPPNPVSEVGIAVIDSRDIHGIPCEKCGSTWWPMIKSHHLRTREYSGLVNREFIQGCPDSFDFGTSAFPNRLELPGAIQAILAPYVEASRDIILVGHDTQHDVRYLASIGVDVSEIKSITRILDSQAIHQAWKKLDNGRGLQGVLADLGIMGKNLHNAGNDAVFTLRALIGVSIQDLRQQEAEQNGSEYEPEMWTA